MGSCTGCGGCCTVITVQRSKEEQLGLAINEGERHRQWVQQLQPLTFEDALVRLPTLSLWDSLEESIREGKEFLYTCGHYDEETRRCAIYEDRPDICRWFPFRQPVGVVSEPTLVGLPKCGYWDEVDQSGDH